MRESESIHNKLRPDEKELRRILKMWDTGEFTIKDIAKRFDRSSKVIKEIIDEHKAIDGISQGDLHSD